MNSIGTQLHTNTASLSDKDEKKSILLRVAKGNDKNDVMSFRTVLRKIWLFPVYLYKKVLSPLLPDACRYSPSCSSYMVQSVQKHGIFKGTFLGINRILRCSALFRGGEDPVPEEFSIKGTFALYAKFWDGKKKEG